MVTSPFHKKRAALPRVTKTYHESTFDFPKTNSISVQQRYQGLRKFAHQMELFHHLRLYRKRINAKYKNKSSSFNEKMQSLHINNKMGKRSQIQTIHHVTTCCIGFNRQDPPPIRAGGNNHRFLKIIVYCMYIQWCRYSITISTIPLHSISKIEGAPTRKGGRLLKNKKIDMFIYFI